MKSSYSTLIIIVSAVAVYLNSLGNAFVWDDIALVVNNDFIKGPILLKQALLAPLYYFGQEPNFYYRPLQTLSYLFDYSVWGLNPFGFHLVNLILHALLALLTYRFIDLIVADREVAFLSAVLFAVHPLNGSVVNYISSRADILLAIFSLLALLSFVKGGKYRFFSLLFFIMALLSKEAAAIFPLGLIFTQEVYFKIRGIRQGRNKARLWYAAFILISLSYLMLRIKVIRIGTDILPPPGTSPWSTIFTFISINIKYISLAYLPFGLHMLRNIPVVMPMAPAFILYGVLVLIFLAASVIIYRFNKRVFLLLGLSFLWLLPTATLFFRYPEYYLQGRAIMPENWFYLSLIGVLAITARSLKMMTARARPAFYIIAWCLAFCFSAITFRGNLTWRNNYALFSRILEYVDDSATAYRNMALLYLNRAENKKAIESYQKALSLKQGDKRKAVLYSGIAMAYLADKKPEDAYDSAKKAVATDGGNADARASLGVVYAARGDSRKAKKEWLESLEIAPFNRLAFDRLVSLSLKDAALREYLIEKYQGIIKEGGIFGNYRAYRGLGIIYLYNNMDSHAFLNFAKSLELDPYEPKSNNGMAICYARSGDSARAAIFFKRSIRLNPFDPEAYRNLSLLYRQLNMTKQSARLLEQAASLNLLQ
ncbi:MAG: hypothetical protein WC469_03745 [Candidatus Omnitrophota bacterium]